MAQNLTDIWQSDKNLTDYWHLHPPIQTLVYERKFKSEYLERQIFERLLKSEPSIVKLIENKSDLSKVSTLSEPSIVKLIANQSEQSTYQS